MLQMGQSPGFGWRICGCMEQVHTSSLNADELAELLAKLNMTADQFVRKTEPYYKDNLRGKELTQNQLIEAMIENPKLIERPIVVNGNKAAIGRPPEAVLEIIK